MARLSIELQMSTRNHPQTDGQTERCIQVLTRLLRSYTQNAQDSWDKWSPQLEFAYNSTYNTAIRASPFEVDLGYCPNEPLLDHDEMANARNSDRQQLMQQLHAITLRTKEFLTENQIDMQSTKNKGRKALVFKVGEWVLLHEDSIFTLRHHGKSQKMYGGPYQVKKVINNNAYELDMPNHPRKHKVVNVQWLKKFVHRTEAYPNESPISSLDKVIRCSEITEVIGYDTLNKIYFCKMSIIDPTITVQYQEHEFNALPETRRKQLMDTFRRTCGNPGEEGGEDVME
ncbi:LAFA_0F01816g1_1 [Lachancea sp. 'fantastica']|nr:LAFA_0F01816g1_1 [Lachancea sp. 'fantastica']